MMRDSNCTDCFFSPQRRIFPSLRAFLFFAVGHDLAEILQHLPWLHLRLWAFAFWVAVALLAAFAVALLRLLAFAVPAAALLLRAVAALLLAVVIGCNGEKSLALVCR